MAVFCQLSCSCVFILCSVNNFSVYLILATVLVSKFKARKRLSGYDRFGGVEKLSIIWIPPNTAYLYVSPLSRHFATCRGVTLLSRSSIYGGSTGNKRCPDLNSVFVVKNCRQNHVSDLYINVRFCYGVSCLA